MPSNSETGHAKNVSNFETLITYCTGYGAQYNPSNKDLSLANLNTLWQQADASLKNVATTQSARKKAVNTRQLEFKPLKSLSTKVLNAVASSDVSDEIIDDVKTINRKIQGQRAGDEKDPTESDPSPSNSVSRQSFDSFIDHYTALTELLGVEPNYNPNEQEIQIATLQQKVMALKDVNKAFKDADVIWSNTRISRDNILYAPKTGLLDVAADVKKYVKSVFGASSPQYKQVSVLKFKRPPED